MVAPDLFVQLWRGKSGHRRTECSITRRDKHPLIMESAAENRPPSGKGEKVV
jgi:hypothetical protein|tara:strand:- start:450 stop:605 length:156 start_codon:yes stop_codon:yes gene_type:complete